MFKKRSQLLTAFLLLLLVQISALNGIAQDTDYHGFKCNNFKFEGYNAKIVFPQNTEAGRHWIWRARFWGHEPQTEIALLKKGFHVVFIDAPELCGNKEAVELWNHFYAYLLKTYQLNEKTVLEGFSRGGLYIYNWGSENTEKVACIYADAPVCDIKSWPGGKGKGKGSPEDWKLHLKVYQQTEESIKDFKGMPIYNARKLALAHVPVLHVCGATDDIVPIEENSYIVQKVYQEAGGDMKIIVKEGIGHHPHSLKDPAPIVNFILSHTAPNLLDAALPFNEKMAINFRGNIDNSRVKFEKEKIGKVAFLGGSITTNHGWRDSISNYLQKRFPDTKFEFINAGIASTGSTPGAFRLNRDVLSKGTIDLLFEEAAVNDATNGVEPQRQVRGMEGIIRHALKNNPKMDIVMLHFVDQDKMADYNNGKIPEVIQQHEKVANYYQITSINLAKEVNDRILNGEFSWRGDFKDLHPSPFGQAIYFRTLKYFFEKSWENNVIAKQKNRVIPSKKFDKYSYSEGTFIAPDKAEIITGWSFLKDWTPKKSSSRNGFVHVPVLEAEQPGAMLKLKFKGNMIGLMITSGPDAGILTYSIDGAPYKTIDQFTTWSDQLHLPWLLILEDELSSGKHTLVLKTEHSKNPRSKGFACRIHQFTVNN